MSEPLSPVQIATELIRATRQEELRRAAARHRTWAKPLRGFRPHMVTKDVMLARVAEFAAAPGLLKDLAEAFLKTTGVPEAGPLEERLAAVAGNGDLPESVRLVCRQLSGREAPPDAEASDVPDDDGTADAHAAEPDRPAAATTPPRRRRTRSTARTG